MKEHRTHGLRYDPGTPLQLLLAGKELSWGNDWRFVDPTEWLQLKQCLVTQGFPCEAERFTWKNMIDAILLGTQQATACGEYPLASASHHKLRGRKDHQHQFHQWVKIGKSKHHVRRSNFFSVDMIPRVLPEGQRPPVVHSHPEPPVVV